MKDFKAKASVLDGVTLHTEKRGIPFRVQLTAKNIRSGPVNQAEGPSKRPMYSLSKIEQICDLYIAGSNLTNQTLIEKGIYKRKGCYSYLFVIVKAIVDGLPEAK